jgi:putative ABC transport system permease protein
MVAACRNLLRHKHLAHAMITSTQIVRAQADALSVGGIDAGLVERATLSLALVAIAVGALQVGVLMTRVVLQRMHEIGVLKASGIADRDIFLVFAFEAVLYGLVGGVLGCLLGLLISVFGPMPDADEALRAALITVVVSTLVAAAAGIAPARKAIRAPAVEALSHSW